jgi:cytochrome b561
MHRSMGALTWVVVATRLIWRHYFAYLPPFPKSMLRLQQQIAKLNEYGLYVLLLLQPLTGLAMMLFRGRPFALFFWKVPASLSRDPTVSSFFLFAHRLGAWGLLALIGLHAAAALLHAFILRDGVIQRMLPWLGQNEFFLQQSGGSEVGLDSFTLWLATAVVRPVASSNWAIIEVR